jgi:hypothetical protein
MDDGDARREPRNLSFVANSRSQSTFAERMSWRTPQPVSIRCRWIRCRFRMNAVRRFISSEDEIHCGTGDSRELFVVPQGGIWAAQTEILVKSLELPHIRIRSTEGDCRN